MVIEAARGTAWRTSANISFGTGTALGYALSVLNCIPHAVASKSLQEADLCPAPRSWCRLGEMARRAARPLSRQLQHSGIPGWSRRSLCVADCSELKPRLLH